jgi:polyphosphate kinase 2 (PPK2 family)
MTLDVSAFRVRERETIRLKKCPTSCKAQYDSTERYEEILQANVKILSEQQQMLYASRRHALLLIFEAMDAAGKDGVISHVISGVNPQGCQVMNYQRPSDEELKHDFLWRTTAICRHWEKSASSIVRTMRKSSLRACTLSCWLQKSSPMIRTCGASAFAP